MPIEHLCPLPTGWRAVTVDIEEGEPVEVHEVPIAAMACWADEWDEGGLVAVVAGAGDFEPVRDAVMILAPGEPVDRGTAMNIAEYRERRRRKLDEHHRRQRTGVTASS